MSGAEISEMRQRMPAAARRTQLLEVALERFASGGYRRTSMEEIADAAGVTKPVLYQHFRSKQQLFGELLSSVGQDLLHEVTSRAAAAATPYQRVLAGFRAYFDFVCQRPNAFKLVFGSDARLSGEFAPLVGQLEGEIAATIGRFIDADIDDEHRDLLGYAIVGLGEVAGRRWMAAGAAAGADPAGAERMALRMADLAWAGLRGLPGGATRRAAAP